MNDNNFEDIVRRKLHQLEIEPSEGLMEKIFEARQKRAAAIVPFWSKKLVTLVIAGLVLGISWVFVNKDKTATLALEARTSEKKEPLLHHHATLSAGNTESFSPTQESEYMLSAEKQQEQNNPQNSVESKYAESQAKGKGRIRASKQGVVNAAKTLSSGATEKSGNYGKEEAQETHFAEERAEAIHYPLSFYGLSHFVAHYAAVKNTLLVQQDLQPVPYKKPRRLRHADTRINEVELNMGVGSWGFSEDYIFPDFTEKPLFSVNANVRTRIKLNKSLSVLTGLSFSQRAASYSYDRTLLKHFMSVDTVHGTIIDPGAPPVSVTRYDTLVGTIAEEYRGSGRNVYRQVSLPLGLEYQTGFKRNIFYVNGGVLLNLYTFDKGQWLPEEGNTLQAFKGKSRQIETGLRTGFFAGLGYGYKLTPEITWIAEGNLSVWGLQRNPLGVETQKMLGIAGLNTGLRWKF